MVGQGPVCVPLFNQPNCPITRTGGRTGVPRQGGRAPARQQRYGVENINPVSRVVVSPQRVKARRNRAAAEQRFSVQRVVNGQ